MCVFKVMSKTGDFIFGFNTVSQGYGYIAGSFDQGNEYLGSVKCRN
jgi:hypothetical protein